LPPGDEVRERDVDETKGDGGQPQRTAEPREHVGEVVGGVEVVEVVVIERADGDDEDHAQPCAEGERGHPLALRQGHGERHRDEHAECRQRFEPCEAVAQ
jgi:hypothetical protein